MADQLVRGDGSPGCYTRLGDDAELDFALQSGNRESPWQHSGTDCLLEVQFKASRRMTDYLVNSLLSSHLSNDAELDLAGEVPRRREHGRRQDGGVLVAVGPQRQDRLPPDLW